ncbi:MAG TPA: hypothetical protein PLR83_00665 [Pyrinomonadaceae bacterium]|nr:hypothetical protein [Pyrinomonadaceae bacterium]
MTKSIETGTAQSPRRDSWSELLAGSFTTDEIQIRNTNPTEKMIEPNKATSGHEAPSLERRSATRKTMTAAAK